MGKMVQWDRSQAFIEAGPNNQSPRNLTAIEM
jgi:hypothetical protein